MILMFIRMLHELGIHVPSAFSYISTRMMFATISTFLFTLLMGKIFIKKLYELKVGHTIRVSDVPVLARQYQKASDIPSMGGLLFLTSLIIADLLWMDLHHIFTLVLLFAALFMGVIGAFDDLLKISKQNKRGASGRKKFFLQALFAILLSSYFYFPALPTFLKERCAITEPVVYEKDIKTKEIKFLSVKEYALRYYIPFLKKPIKTGGRVSIVLGILFTAFVISGSTNAVNLSDGLDGLAAGLSILAAVVLAIVAFLSNNFSVATYLNILYIEGSGEIAIFLSSLIGALLGFLWFNGYPAQIFMGDTGSLALGGILGVSSVLLRREFLLALIAGVFVMETLSVILQVLSFRYRGGKRIFLCAPLHHHFQMKGWHEVKVVTRFWMIALLFAIIGLISLKMQ